MNISLKRIAAMTALTLTPVAAFAATQGEACSSLCMQFCALIGACPCG